MANVHTLNEINNGTSLVFSNKLGDLPFNRYPPSRTEFENQLACANREWEIAISCGNQLGSRCNLLIKNNERLTERVCQLEDEVRELKNQIIHKDISFTKAENEISIKLEEIQTFQSEIKELEMKYFLA